MTEAILFILGAAALFAASINDFKIREVPDWVSFSLMASAIAVRLMISVYYDDYSIILSGIIGLAIMIVLGYLMYYTGQWGGGDSKIIMGLGALMGFELSLSEGIISLMINVLIIGAVYGIIWNLFIAIKNFSRFRKKLVSDIKEPKVMKIRLIVMIISLMIAASAFFLQDMLLRLLALFIALSAILIFYMIMSARVIEKEFMIRDIRIEDLREGDWIVDDIYDNKKKVCSPKDLGISKKQIEKLKSMKSRKMINKIRIKEGIPFVPAILIAFIITYYAGNIVLLLVN